MIDHIGIAVGDFARARTFHDAVLAPLGVTRLMEVAEGDGGWAGHGATGKAWFWIGTGRPADRGVHVAFAAPDRATVAAFHAAALAAGGEDNGAPGLRPQYHPRYHGAFVLDPDANKIEAVCHCPA